MKRLPLFAALALAALATAAGAQQAARKPYVVQLSDKPIVSYDGQIAGLAATRPAAGSRLNINASDVQAYGAYLSSKQNTVLADVPAAQVLYRYRNLINGFAALLTDAEFAKLVTNPGVQSITVDEPMPMDTVTTPRFLGINQPPSGVWTRFDALGRPIKGENIIIGHLDGGVWPENPSFSDKVDGNGKPISSHLPGTVVYNALPPGRWAGTCQAGLGFNASHCNQKLIGARFFNATWKAVEGTGGVRTWSGEYLDSVRDPGGHGTHTLSTSGGNENVTAIVSGSPFVITGIAPRARVAAYKVCYVSADANDVPNPNGGSCFQGDSAAAADAAVADGVDVINFSVGGSRTSVQGPVDTAFANAAFAGVFVATSAGNSNVFPGNASTVAHVSPWTTTVGNSTHDRFTAATATLGNGVTATGPSFQTTGVTSRAIVLATEAGITPFASLSNTDKLALARCYNAADRGTLGGSAAAALDPAKVAGKIVVCYRGGNVLVNKTASVRDNGGSGVIIQNLPAGLLAAPLDAATNNTTLNIAHVVPTIHLSAANAAAVVGYAAGGAGTASFAASVQVPGAIAPVMADTSSRGPNQRDLNLLKPDITAPGTDIIAAYTNTSITPAQRLQIIAGTLIPEPGADMISGTSMASPHVAGAAALLKQAYPDWSPNAIRSALMTSAQQTVKLANGAVDPSPWGFGSGHLNPNGALDTGVVYDQSNSDHIDYYFGAINGRSLNTASLTHANVVGIGSLTRTLTNKGASPVTLTASAALPGFTVAVSPSSLTIPAGGSASYTATVTRAGAPIEAWQFGNVTWSGSGQNLRSPLSAKAQLITVLSSVTDTRAAATKIYTAGFGYNGNLFTTGVGLVPATVADGAVAINQRQCFAIGNLPAGVKLLRASLFNTDTAGGAATDLDLVVQRNGANVGTSGNGDSNETVILSNPAAGTYQACVDGFATLGGAPAAFKLSWWVVGPANPGSLRAFGPRTVTIGAVASIGLNWSVPDGARYLGLVEHRDTAGAAPIATTQVFIDASAGTTATQSAIVVRNKPVPIE